MAAPLLEPSAKLVSRDFRLFDVCWYVIHKLIVSSSFLKEGSVHSVIFTWLHEVLFCNISSLSKSAAVLLVFGSFFYTS